jgi:hypothetical protein
MSGSSLIGGLSPMDKTDLVRKQYHFWPGEEGVDAWDVDRLVALAADLPVEEVQLSSISEIDSNYWFRHGYEPTVRAVVEHARLMLEVDTSYPVILGHDGRVMDGMHRIARALCEHRSSIPAVKLSGPVAPDYRNCRPQDLPYE